MSFTAKFDFLAIDKFSAPIRKMNDALNSIQTTINNTSAKMAKLGESIKKAGASMAAAGSKMRNTGRSMLASVSLPILGVGTGAVVAAANMETLSMSFEVMLKSGDKAKALVSDLAKFGAATPFETAELGGVAKQLLAVGIPLGSVMDKMQLLGDISSGSGKQISEVAAIYGKAFSKGKVDTELLNQLVEGGIPIMAELGKTTGKNTKQLYDMAAKGSISFKMLDKAMGKMVGTGGLYHDMMIKQSTTTAGLFSTMKDSLTFAGATLGTTLIKTLKINEAMASVSKWVGDAAAKFAKWAEANPQLAKMVVYGALILGLLAPALILIGMLASGIGAVVVGFGALVTGGGALLGFLGAISAPVLIAVAALTALYFALSKISDMIGTEGWDKIFQLFGNGAVNEVNAMYGGGAIPAQQKQKVGVDVNVSGQVNGAKTKTTATVKRGSNM